MCRRKPDNIRYYDTSADLTNGEYAELGVGDLPVWVQASPSLLLAPGEDVLPGRAALLLLEAASLEAPCNTAGLALMI